MNTLTYNEKRLYKYNNLILIENLSLHLLVYPN